MMQGKFLSFQCHPHMHPTRSVAFSLQPLVSACLDLSSHCDLCTFRLASTFGEHPLLPLEIHPDLLAGAAGTDDFLLPAGAELARQVEARTDPLYRATPRDDGLFHCPWEGDESCNHKPDKLKCNYE
jgi:hypothetical protein